MENKLSLQEYANLKQISLVTVNKHIKKGLINSVKEGARRYIILDTEEIEVTNSFKKNKLDLLTNLETLYEARIQDLERVNKQFLKQNKQLNKQLETKDKRIKKLEEELRELNNETKDVYRQFIGEMKTLMLPQKKEKKKKK